MSEKHYVVQGAICQCTLSVNPQTADRLMVKTHNKHFGNERETSKKLIATTKELGASLQNNTLGKCKNQPYGNDFLPCTVDITEWNDFKEKITMSNQGQKLLEDSTATCSHGTPGCIKIVDHGQIAEPSEQNFKNINPMLHNLINPMVDVRDVYAKEPKHEGIKTSGEKTQHIELYVKE